MFGQSTRDSLLLVVRSSYSIITVANYTATDFAISRRFAFRRFRIFPLRRRNRRSNSRSFSLCFFFFGHCAFSSAIFLILAILPLPKENVSISPQPFKSSLYDMKISRLHFTRYPYLASHLGENRNYITSVSTFELFRDIYRCSLFLSLRLHFHTRTIPFPTSHLFARPSPYFQISLPLKKKKCSYSLTVSPPDLTIRSLFTLELFFFSSLVTATRHSLASRERAPELVLRRDRALHLYSPPFFRDYSRFATPFRHIVHRQFYSARGRACYLRGDERGRGGDRRRKRGETR